MCDTAEAFTGVLCTPNRHIDSGGELYDGKCIQNARDPFFLPRYRVGSVMTRVNKRIQVDDGRLNLWARTIWENAVMRV